jgi:hypothetical protein
MTIKSNEWINSGKMQFIYNKNIAIWMKRLIDV